MRVWIIKYDDNYNDIDNVIDHAQVVGRGPSVCLDNSGSFNDYDDVIDTWPFNI